MPYGSPNKMGHSPAEMESAKQEKYNLMQDMPVVKHASWMSKHSKSALNMGHSPLKNEGDDEGAARREYDLRQGIVDPKTGKRVFKKRDPNAPKKFVTKKGKALTVGSSAVGQMKYDSPAGKHCM